MTKVWIKRPLKGIHLWVIEVTTYGGSATVSSPGDFWHAWRKSLRVAAFLQLCYRDDGGLAGLGYDWISTSDSMPERGKRVLLWVEGAVVWGYLGTESKGFWWQRGDTEGYSDVGLVSHWQPLPEAPQDGS